MSLPAWRQAVRDRAGGYCEICGEVGTNAHHIHCVGYFPEEQQLIENGVLLCRACHVIAHRGKFGATAKGKWSPDETRARFRARATSADVYQLIESIIAGDCANVAAATE